MNCPTCGTKNGDNARFCVNCGQELDAMQNMPHGGNQYSSYRSAGGPTQHISNYLIPSVLVTIFCCLPLGIAAIVFAAQVNGKIAAGDIVGAQSASRTARTLVLVSVAIGLIFIVAAVVSGLLG